MTTVPFPIPARKRIGRERREPAVVARSIGVRITPIPRQPIVLGWRCGAHGTTTIIAAIRDGVPRPGRISIPCGRVPAVSAETILLRKTIILTRIVVRLLHLQCCLSVTKKKSLRGTIRTVDVVAATAAAATIEHRKGAEQDTSSSDHQSHWNATVLLLGGRCPVSSFVLTERQRRSRRRRNKGKQRRGFLGSVVVVGMGGILVRHDRMKVG